MKKTKKFKKLDEKKAEKFDKNTEKNKFFSVSETLKQKVSDNLEKEKIKIINKLKNIEVSEGFDGERIEKSVEEKEDLENIVEINDSILSFNPKNLDLEEISPSLKERERGLQLENLGNIRTDQSENESQQQNIYQPASAGDLVQNNQKGYNLSPNYLSANDYFSSVQTPDGSSGRFITDMPREQEFSSFREGTIGMGLNSGNMGRGTIQQQGINQQQGFTERSYETEWEKKLKEDRKRNI